MRMFFIGLMLASCCLEAALAEEPASPKLPEGYKLQYQQALDGPAAIADFVFSDPAAWKLQKMDDRWALAQVAQSKYKPEHRSPLNISLIKGQQFADFVLEVELQQTGKEYGHRDMCLYFGFQDPKHYYYVHIATKTDDHAHNIFIVNDAARKKISTKTTAGYDWGPPGTWRKIRLERSAKTGQTSLFIDDATKPIMTAEDKTFGAGWVGFGSFDDTGLVDSIRIWAPEAVKKDVSFFQGAKQP